MSLLLGLARLAAFAALPLGWIGDHTGRRRPLLIAVTLVVAGGTLSGLVVEAWQFGLFHSILRTGTAAVSALSIVIVAETVSRGVRAYAISFYGAAVSFGSGIALMALPLADGGGESWRVPYLLTAVGLLLMPFLVRNVPEPEVYLKDPKGGHWSELTGGVWSKRFWTVTIASFLAAAYGAVGAAFSTERMINQVGFTTGETVLTLLAGGTLGAVGFFVGGHLSDAWGRRATSILSLTLALVGGIVLYSTIHPALVVAAAMVSAFGTFAFVPAAGSHRAELFPTHLRSSANTASVNFGMAGSAAGLMSGIWTIDRFGLSNTVYMLGIGVAMAAILTAQLPETRGQDLTAVSTDRR